MAGYSTPYAFANYIGEWANDAAVLTEIQARKWDSTADGTGTPRNGMTYYATGAHQVRSYIAGAWVAMGTSASSTLDAAYNASAGAAVITVDAGDVTWNQTGAFSFVVDVSACTGVADGFGVEDGTDYLRATHAAANTLNLMGALGILNLAASGAATIDSDAAATLSGLTVTIAADGGVVDVDATGAVSINSSAGVINIGNNAIAQNINVGTAGARTIKIGSATATALDLDASGAVTIDSIAAGISIDAALTSNLAVSTSGNHLTVQCYGGGAQKLMLSSAGTGVDAVEIDATAGGVSIDAIKSSNLSVTGAAQSLTLEALGGGVQSVVINSAGTSAAAIDVNATAGGMQLDALLGISIDAHTVSNFSVNGSGQHLTIECFGGGAQKLNLSSSGTGVDAIDITSVAGGIEIDAVKAIEINSSGGIISVGNDANDFGINVGTAGVRTITIGNVAATEVQVDALLVDINAGATGLTVDSAGAITVNSSAGSIGIGNVADNFGIDIGTLGVRTIAIGSAAATAVNIDAIAFSLDATTISNITVTGAAQWLTLAVAGGGAQCLVLDSAGTGINAVDIDARSGGVAIDAALASNFTVSGAAADLTLGARAQTIALNEAAPNDVLVGYANTSIVGALNEVMAAVVTENLWDRAGTVLSPHTAGDTLDIDASGTGITFDSDTTSNFTVTGSAESLALAVVGGGAQKLTLDSAGTGVDSIDITSSVGGIELNSALGVAIIGAATVSTTLGVTGLLTATGGVKIANNQYLYSDVNIGSIRTNSTGQTVDCMMILPGATPNYTIFCEYDDRVFDFGHTQQTNPTLYGHSNRQSQVEYWSLTHDTADVVYSTAFGGHTFTTQDQRARGTIDFPGGVPIADETFVLNATTMTWKADGTGNVDHVTIGANAAECVTNLVVSIAECTESGNLTAWAGAADTVVVEWGTGGVAGNAIVFTEACTNMTMDGAGTLGTTHSGVAATTLLTIGEDGAVGVTGVLTASGGASFPAGLSPGANAGIQTSSTVGSLRMSNTAQTVPSTTLLTGTGPNHFIICEYGDRAFDFQQVQRTNPTLVIQSANQSTTEFRSFAHNQVDAFDEIGSGSHVTEHQAPTELADDGSFNLPANSAGWCFILVGDSEEFAHFTWDSTEVVDLISNSANVVTTDTDTNLCIFDGTGFVTVRNRLGAAKKVMFDLHYYTP